MSRWTKIFAGRWAAHFGLWKSGDPLPAGWRSRRDETINYISPLHGPDGPKNSKGNSTSSGIPLAGWRNSLHGTKAKGPPSSDLDIVQCCRKDLNSDGGPL